MQKCFSLFLGSLVGFTSLYVTPAHAEALKYWLEIPLKLTDGLSSPAADLMDEAGNKLSSTDALELYRQGKDLSKLNPAPSLLWTPDSLSPEDPQMADAPPEGASFDFLAFLRSPTEVYQLAVETSDPHREGRKTPYRMTLSLRSHGILTHAALLRQIGYRFPVPRYYKKLTLKFPDQDYLNRFLTRLEEITATSERFWVHSKIEDPVSGRFELTLKGAVLEPATVESPNTYWGVHFGTFEQTQRTFRALALSFSLTEIPELINDYEWTIGRKMGNKISLPLLSSHVANTLKNATGDDLIWMMRRLATLTRTQLQNAVAQSRLPDDIQALVVEKLISRRNSAIKLLGLKSSLGQQEFDSKLTTGRIKKGQLRSFDEQHDYALPVYKEPEKSPYRIGEILRYLRVQALYAGIGSLFQHINREYIPSLGPEDALENFRDELAELHRDHVESGGKGPVKIPLKVWPNLVASANVTPGRSVVFGTYLGNDTPLQLVDSINGRLEIGVHGLLSGLGRNMPTAGIKGSLSRSYVHLKPVENIRSASRAKLKSLWVPGLMIRLAKMLDEDITCDIAKKVWSVSSMIGGITVWTIHFDDSIAGEIHSVERDALVAAERSRLIAEGAVADQILVKAADREEACDSMENSALAAQVKNFLNELAPSETFIVTDQIQAMASFNANMRVPFRLPIPLTVSAGAELGYGVLGSTQIRKKFNQIEVILTEQKTLRHKREVDLGSYLPLIKPGTTQQDGEMESEVFSLPLTGEGLSDDQVKLTLQTLYDLLKKTRKRSLRENFTPVTADHEVKNKLRTLDLLWWKRERLKMSQEVEVQMSAKDEADPARMESIRLYSASDILRKGRDLYQFANRAVRQWIPFFNLGLTNSDPGQSIKGKSNRTYFVTEAALNEDRPFEPVARIERFWNGWDVKPDKLFNTIHALEEEVRPYLGDNDLIPEETLAQTRKLLEYELRNSIILYPDALNLLYGAVLGAPIESKAIQFLVQLYGIERWKNECALHQSTSDSVNSYHYFGTDKVTYCIPPSLQEILRSRRKLARLDRKGKLDRKKKIDALNTSLRSLNQSIGTGRLLHFFGPDKFTATTRIQGFRSQDELGFVSHMSDLIGEYDPRYGTGIYDEVSRVTGIPSYDLRAMQFTPGM